MKDKIRRGMNALDPNATSYPSSLRSVGMEPSGKWADVSRTSGLGDAIMQRREAAKQNRAKVKARRKHSKRTR